MPERRNNSKRMSIPGPVPSHKKDTMLQMDFTASADLVRDIETLCLKDADPLNDSQTPLLLNSSTRPIGESSVLIENESSNSSVETSGFDTGSSNGSEEDLDGVGISQKKLIKEKDVESLDIKHSDKINEDDDELPHGNANPLLRAIVFPVNFIKEFVVKHQKVILLISAILFCFGLTAYMIVAMVWDFERAIPLFVIWCVVVGYNIYAQIRDRFGDEIYDSFLPFLKYCNQNMYWIKWIFIAAVVAGLAVWIALDTSQRPEQLVSGAGYLVFLFCLFITSKYPDRVRWRPVLWGLLIQICLGMFILRTQAGFDAFNWVGEFAQTFINYVDAGASFVFGANFEEHNFAFKVLPIVVYFSAFISVMYYLGAMQWLILKIGWLMQISLGTSATESMVAAGNIFVGQTESPLLIRPYINDLTTSELHAIMTAGFGTIAGSVLGAYLGFGIQAVYVITACVMAAPCALATSKLCYPETKRSKFAKTEGLILEKTDQRNIIEAAFVGASQAIPLVLNIGANLIAFLSLLAAINGFLNWFGGLLDYPQLSFEVICSYVFMPVTFLMGVNWEDCFKAAELIGTKIFLNEFIAYEKLSLLIDNRDAGTMPRVDPVSGEVLWVDERTEAIITYALCGFANVGSLGIMLGGLGSMAPKRQSEMAKIVIRALIAGIFVSILNACVAGFLYVPRPIYCNDMLATTNWTDSDPSRLFQCCSTAIGLGNTSIGACNCCKEYVWTDTSFTLNCTSLTCL